MNKENYFLLGTMLFSLAAMNQSVLARPAPTGTQFGGMTLNPYVNVEFQQDDNVLADADASVASGVILAQPKLLMSGEGSSRKIGFYYTGQYARYMDSPKDDYQDHVFGFEGQQLLGTSAHIDFAADYSQNHENRGSGYSQGLGDSLAQPDLFANTRVEMNYVLGSSDSVGRFDIGVDALQHNFTTRESITETRDRNAYTGHAAFYLNLSEITSLLVEARYGQLDYAVDPTNNSLDSTEQRFFVGASWEMSALTKGSLRLGLQTKQFEEESRGVFAGLGWEADIDWSPIRFMQVNLSSRGATEEPNGLGNYIESKGGSVSLKYELTQDFAIDLNSGLTKKDYQPLNVSEQIMSATMGADYALAKWLTVGGRFAFVSRDSEAADDLDYQRRIVSLFVEGTL